MFDNIGGKLKALSKFVCYVGDHLQHHRRNCAVDV